MAKELLVSAYTIPFLGLTYTTDTSLSIFNGGEWVTRPPFLVDMVDQPPTGTTTFPDCTFQTPNNGTKLGPVWLKYSVSAINRNGTGTYARLPQWAGFRNIDVVTVRYGSNRLEEMTGEGMLKKMLKHSKQSDQDIIAQGAGGNLTDAQRNQLALAQQDFCVPLWLFWTDEPRKYLPAELFARGLDICIKFKNPLAQIMYSDADNPVATITNPNLRCMMINVTAQEAQDIKAKLASADGMNIPFEEVQLIEDTRLLTGSTVYNNFKLDGLRSNVTDYLLEVHLSSDIFTPNKYEPDNYIIWNTWGVKANLQDLVRPVEFNFMQYELWRLFYADTPMIYGLTAGSFNFAPEDDYNCYGSVYFGGLRDPCGSMTFAPGVLNGAGGYTIRLYAFVRNCINVKANNIQKLLV